MVSDYSIGIAGWVWICLLLGLSGCGGGSSGSDDTVETRSFLMGATPFFASFDGSRTVFPDWRFENLDDRDLLSLHVDDFWGVPWDYCDASACCGISRPSACSSLPCPV